MGSNAQTYQFKYHNPWMFGKHRSLTYRAWNTRGNFGYNNMLVSGYRPEIRYGMDTSIGLPHSYELRSNHKVKIEEVQVEEYNDSDAYEYSIQSYTYAVSHDTRDFRANPLNGHYYIVSIENGFGFKSDSLQFTKYDLTASHFFKHLKSKPLQHDYWLAQSMAMSKTPSITL